MILVAGSTGLLGSEICRLLKKDRKAVRALVRSSSQIDKVEKLHNYGVDLSQGDLKDINSLHEACNGIHTVISTASSTLSRADGDTIESVDLQGQINLIDAAKMEGVKRFVYISFVDNPKIKFPLSDAKLEVERYLENSGLTYTILRANYFMEVWLSNALGFDAENASAKIYGAGINKLNWISYFDVADLAVQCLKTVETFYRTIDIGGPEALSPLDVVKIFENVGGLKFTTEHVSEVNLRAQLKSADDPLQASFAGLMLQYAEGVETSDDYLKYMPTRLTTVKSFAERMLAPAHY